MAARTDLEPITVIATCPLCATTIPVLISWRANGTRREGSRMVSRFEAIPDLTDVYAHVWTHEHQEGSD